MYLIANRSKYYKLESLQREETRVSIDFAMIIPIFKCPLGPFPHAESLKRSMRKWCLCTKGKR